MCTVTPNARLTLAPRPESAALARTFLRDRHCVRHDANVVETAVLLVTELVANAVRHGSAPITVEIECDTSHTLQVRVSDGSPLPPARRRAGPDDEGGRGLSIVELLSDAWGVDLHGDGRDGKSVWFVLRASQGPRRDGAETEGRPPARCESQQVDDPGRT